MPANEKLVKRVQAIIKGRKGLFERKMFGGVCFFINGNMSCGVEKDNLVVRVGPDKYEDALRKVHVRPMDFTGRPLRGFVYVSPAAIKTAATLKKWVDQGVQFARSLPAK